MHVTFDLRELRQDWRPPFKKDVRENEVTVSEGESYAPDGAGKNVFKLVSVQGNMALIEFDQEYTLKGHEHPTNRQVLIDASDFKSFSALWKQDGLTMKLRVKNIVP